MEAVRGNGEGRARAGRRGPSSREDLAERVKLIESSLTNVFIGNALCLAIVTAMLHDAFEPGFFWPWLGAQLAIGAWRVLTLVGGRPLARDPDNVEARHLAAIVHASLSGPMWGLLGFVAVGSGDMPATLVSVMVATGLIGGATALIGHLPSVYLPYALGVGLLPAARLLTIDSVNGLGWIGVLLVIYTGFSVVAATSARKLVSQAIALRFRNADLLDGLRAAHRRTDDARRRTERALEREQRANLAKSSFLAAASHDLRQPLHSLRLHATTLQTRTRGTEHEASAHMIGRSLGALEELFDAILDVSRLDAGTLRPEFGAVALAPLVDALIEEVRPQATEAGLEIAASVSEAVVRTDPVLLKRLVRNLLSNAIRYTVEGSVRVRASPAPTGGLVLEVVDTGPGIAPEARERVFEEFVQLDNPERDRSRGIGLGLSIVRRVAALLELGVSIGETPGGGTTVRVEIPVALTGRPDRSAGPTPSGPAEPADPPAAGSAALTALVIDDEEAVREAMALFLEVHGCRVIPADGADEAIAALGRAALVPDSIVCDYRLRGEERGTEAIRRVREHCGREVPAVLVTGDLAAERLQEIGQSGLRTLHKPCDPHQLLEILREHAGGDEHSRGDVRADRAVPDAP